MIDIYNGVDEVVPSSEWGSDRWNAYMSRYESIENLSVFTKLRDTFRRYQDICEVDCIYLMVNKHDIPQVRQDCGQNGRGCIQESGSGHV